jgi:hypothetical protein
MFTDFLPAGDLEKQCSKVPSAGKDANMESLWVCRNPALPRQRRMKNNIKEVGILNFFKIILIRRVSLYG